MLLLGVWVDPRTTENGQKNRSPFMLWRSAPVNCATAVPPVVVDSHISWISFPRRQWKLQTLEIHGWWITEAVSSEARNSFWVWLSAVLRRILNLQTRVKVLRSCSLHVIYWFVWGFRSCSCSELELFWSFKCSILMSEFGNPSNCFLNVQYWWEKHPQFVNYVFEILTEG